MVHHCINKDKLPTTSGASSTDQDHPQMQLSVASYEIFFILENNPDSPARMNLSASHSYALSHSLTSSPNAEYIFSVELKRSTPITSKISTSRPRPTVEAAFLKTTQMLRSTDQGAPARLSSYTYSEGRWGRGDLQDCFERRLIEDSRNRGKRGHR